MKKIVLMKTTTYAAMHIVIAFFVAWAVSGSLVIALGISLAEPAVQILGFYIHEKLWFRYGNVPASAGFDANPCCAPFTSAKSQGEEEQK